ncbi:hypothetical protein WH47_11835 [Habropoda laboriosa]|uniref:Uncharacterized protein n=1 Tax=Habropoda laboriosa TaxID=597456 RepID=A0A0L7R8M2_9HYME|nr:hypothetical protein WH47_11835 [Habropoda laboriosa]
MYGSRQLRATDASAGRTRTTVISLLPRGIIVPVAILQKMIYDHRYCVSRNGARESSS